MTSMPKRIIRRVDALIRPSTYLSLIIILILDLWLLLLAPAAVQDKFLILGVIILSALMATCGWMWSGHVSRRLSRRNQAVQLLLILREPHINQWKEDVYDYIRQRDKGKDPPFPVQSAEKLLGLYELISIAVMNGTADDEMVKESQHFVFLRLYKGLERYILERQKDYSSVYCHFSHYAKYWNPGVQEFTGPSFIGPDNEFLAPDPG